MKEPLSVLKAYWGYEAFREPQEEIIHSVLSGRDTLALLPTGGGKSICFQVPGLILDGITLVISPLIALMQDQVQNLQKRNIKATYLNATLPKHFQKKRLLELQLGYYKFLYLAPERLLSPSFLDYLSQLPITLIAVDEAHCISQWGYDFRPHYLKIAYIRNFFPQTPVIALTASATSEVQQDIIQKLLFKPNYQVFKKSFTRPNLQYVVLYEENKRQKILEILGKVKGSGIIYVRSRKKTQEIADWLVQQGISAAPFHARMSSETKYLVQKQWVQDHYRVIVATNAFGMGIDKPNVRFVIHWQMPPDLESYYQEAGRAGRDNQKAYAVLFYKPNDALEIHEQLKQQFPEWNFAITIINHLYDYLKIPLYHKSNQRFFLTDLATFLKMYNYSIHQLLGCLKILEIAGFITFHNHEDNYAWIQIIAKPHVYHECIEQYEASYFVMQAILREIGGEIFSHPMPFIPSQLLKKHNLNDQEFYRVLSFLAQRSIISFQPPKDEPFFLLQKEREPFSPLNLAWDTLLFLKNQALMRLQNMVLYAENKDSCRSVLISNYFGENNAPPCGKCDICLGRHTTSKTTYPEHDLEKQILNLLNDGETNYQAIIQKIHHANPNLTKQMLQKMIENEILLLKDYKLTINPKYRKK